METQLLWHKKYLIFSGVGCFLISFVLATEFVGTNYRVLVGILIEIPFALGELYLIMLAYFIRDWQDLQVSLNQHSCKIFIVENIAIFLTYKLVKYFLIVN